MSFHIASQTIDVPALGLTITFGTDPADTSKVTCDIASSGHTDLNEDGQVDGETSPPHHLALCFNRGGNLLYKRVTDPEGEGTHEEVAIKPIADVSDPRPTPTVVNTVSTITKPEPVEEEAHVDGEGKPAPTSGLDASKPADDTPPDAYVPGSDTKPVQPFSTSGF